MSMKQAYRWTLVASAVLLTAQATQAQSGSSASALQLTTRPLQFSGTAGADANDSSDSLTLRTRSLQFTGVAGR